MSSNLGQKTDIQFPSNTMERERRSVTFRSFSNSLETKDETIGGNGFEKDKRRIYSVSSDVIPQTIIVREGSSRERGNSRISNTTTSTMSDLTIGTNNDSLDLNKQATNSSIIDKDIILSNKDNLQKLNKNFNDKYRDLSSKNNIPKWSNIGFQSIFQGSKSKKSTMSIKSDKSSISSPSSTANSTTISITSSTKSNKTISHSSNNDNNNKTLDNSDSFSNLTKTTHIIPIKKSSESLNKSFRPYGPLRSLSSRHTTNDFVSLHSNVDIDGKPYNTRRNSIFSLSRIKDNTEKLSSKKKNINNNSNDNDNYPNNKSGILTSNSSNNYGGRKIVSTQSLNTNQTRSPRDYSTVSSIGRKTSNANMSIISTISNSSSNNNVKNNKNNPFVKLTKKLFSSKSNQHLKDTTEPVIPNSLGKFLHSSIGKHRSPVYFIHNTTGGIMDSGKSVYSFNPTVLNATNDAALAITQQDDMLDSTNVAILHDLLKNLSSLETNYKDFNTQELVILSGNIWGIYCSVIVELFKRQRIWQLPAKIEDLNGILRFYIKLKTRSKISVTWIKLISEVEEFIITSLYVFENQVVFNYTNEDTINTALKRLGVLWQIFYQEIYYDVVAVLLPLETSYRNQLKLNDVNKRNKLPLMNSKNETNSGHYISNKNKSDNNNGNGNDNKDRSEVSSLDDYLDREIIGMNRLDSDDTILKRNNDYSSNTLSAITSVSANSSSSNLILQMNNNMSLDLNVDFSKINRSNGNLNINVNRYDSSGNNSSDNDKINGYNINAISSTTNANVNNYNSSNNMSGDGVSICNGKFSIENMLLKCFRDSIVLPYYQNFIHSDEGVSKSFYTYILNEEEESGVTEEDKLILLQCLGILSTIQGKDENQQIIEDLLEGVRMSI